MTCTVLTISRTLAAGGEEIGFTAAMELGFRYADEEIIVRAAGTAGVSPQTVAAIEHTPGLVTRILEAMARTPPDPEGLGYTAMIGESRADFQGLIERVIRETAAQGSVVIVAHAASVPLTGMNGLLRSFITAPRDARIARLVRDAGMAEAQARKATEESDRQRREYLRRFYDVREELPTHYDLVLNTDVLTVPAAAQLLIAAAKSI
jgi:cytidylate kinase